MSKLSAADAVQYLFDRPNEPSFNRKGPDGGVQFQVPASYVTDEYKKVADQIGTRGSAPTSVYKVKELPARDLPDLRITLALPRNTAFSVFNLFHRNCANQLIDALLDSKSLDDFNSIAVYARDRVNQYLFFYAMSVAYLHRSDTKKGSLPSHMSSFPMLYMDRAVQLRAREENSVVPEGSRIAIAISQDYSASDLDKEHKVAYFREDVGINLHHWHWHLVYPMTGRKETVNKDRRGELFYYMHQQLLARYNLERLSNSLPRTRPFIDLHETLEEGYYPKLDDSIASRTWPSRKPNMQLSDINREGDRLQVRIQDLDRWKNRIFDVIDSGRYLKPDGTYERLNPNGDKPDAGIDILGNMIESSSLSPNRTYYGDLHNRGHMLIAFSHDPENRYLENFGVMNDTATAMRDPLFYRWHATINDIFDVYRNTLTPYTQEELTFKDIRVNSIKITTPQLKDNEINTFWQQANIDLSRGLDFSENKGSVFAQVTHLQHAPFQYNITVQNNGSARLGTVRIFYAPKLSEQGTPIQLYYQRNVMIELDRFSVNLQRGTNNIVRQSKDSSVTIPYEQTFRHLANAPQLGNDSQAWNFCGCGWPAHMLVAKGNAAGLVCDLFVMISDHSQDKVQGSDSSKQACDDASSFCGIRDSKYPDKNSMGYPFDRPPRDEAITLKDFLTPNMFTLEIKIKFTDRIVAPIQKIGDPILVRTSETDSV